MTTPSSLRALRAYLDATMPKEQSPGGEGRGRRTPLFVTLSRQTGAGGNSVAEALKEILTEERVGDPAVAWTVFDREVLRLVVDEHHLPEAAMRDLEETKARSVSRVVEEMLGVKFPRHALVALTSRTILHLASRGNSIIVGRGGSIVTRSLSGGIHVRLVGSRERRLEHLMRRFEITRREAQSLIDHEDGGRARYVRQYFRCEIDSPLLYDLVLNTDYLGHRRAARVIADALLASQGVFPAAG